MSKIYLDNNATTLIHKDVKTELNKWLDKISNPSTLTSIGIEGMHSIKECEAYLSKRFVLNKSHRIIFNSGASEGNSHIIMSALFPSITSKPHMIISSIEHPSIRDPIIKLAKLDKLTVTLIKPNRTGIINPQKVISSIKSNTVLVSIMYANNEIGSINDIQTVARECMKRKILFHSDITQIFSKLPDKLDMSNIGAVTGTFHKMHCPIGIGFEIIDATYQFYPLVYGKQQDEFRGGTQSVALIASVHIGMKLCFEERKQKNKRLYEMQEIILKKLEDKYKVIYFYEYDESKYKDVNEYVIVFGDRSMKNRLPNTLLISLVCENMCNVKFKKYLDDHDIIVSIGSACNSDSKKASHIIDELNVPLHIRRGILRISSSDMTTPDEINTLIDMLLTFPSIAKSL